MSQRGGHFDCRDHSWCCDQNSPEYVDDDDTVRLPLRLNKIAERENGVVVSVGVHEGNRPYMEDRHRVMYARDGHRGYFAVHDGHGGSEAAQYLAENLYEDMITAIDEKLRSNKRFKSEPDVSSKRSKKEEQKPSSSISRDSPSSESSKSSSPSAKQANGVVQKNSRNSPASASSPNSLNELKISSSNASPSDVELDNVSSPRINNADKLKNGPSPSPASQGTNPDATSSAIDVKHKIGDAASPKYDVHLEDHETTETVELVGEALREACFSCESYLLDCARTHNFTSGSTSVSVFIRGNHLYAVNVGDSRAVLCRNGQAIDLSNDHKPGVPSERERIEEHEGEVGQMVKSLPLCCAFFGERERSVGAYRVWPGGLSVSRTFGDVNYKDPSLGKTHSPHILIADPEIKVMEITPQDDFMILATDGFWDVMSSQDAVKFLRKKKQKKKFVPGRAGSMLCDRAYNFGSGDNITCIVVYFTHHCDSWARTPHRTPDELERAPYRVDAACQTLASMVTSTGPTSNGVDTSSDAHVADTHAAQGDGEHELKTPDPDQQLPNTVTSSLDVENATTSPDSRTPASNNENSRRCSHSKSKSNRKSMSKSHSKSRPRDATKRKSSRSGSYNRSASKNDSRNGYRRESLVENSQGAEQELSKSGSRASSGSKPVTHPTTQSLEPVASEPAITSENSTRDEKSRKTSDAPSQSSSQHSNGKNHRRERTEPTPASDSPYADVTGALKKRNSLSLPTPLKISPTDALPTLDTESLSIDSTSSLVDMKPADSADTSVVTTDESNP